MYIKSTAKNDWYGGAQQANFGILSLSSADPVRKKEIHMRETWIRSSVVALVLIAIAASLFAQTASDYEQTVPPAGRFRRRMVELPRKSRHDSR